jgi:hypothetical protein
VIAGCARQLRTTMSGVIGLDFGAVLAMGEHGGADMAMLASALPTVEHVLLDRLEDDGDAGTR